MRRDELLKDILEGNDREEAKWKTTMSTLDWMMKRDATGYTYQNLKEMAHCQRAWRDWCVKPGIGQRC